ncbi:LysR substrate-binding domain-containing protein [Compostimonas suwonensis]|uniref:DNA-binding transcriptional LysR family regulator n=1 Tax=Compostimonas suwonensis TaxID=1048394 RepID=A0A2M9C3T4_9MICO|nr:LysR substrate-binding domain-containing protein [Compostimonas suwonensis]PJJ65193.1 DNA-binding transcriptional LysR family regulator [Compostimonas suwonensis]
MLELRRLRLLRELKVRGTLSGVADALSYSPSSVSQQLALLEQEAGVTLFIKSGRKVQLTPQAELLVEHTTHLLERMELAETELRASLTEVTGTVRVAVFQSAAHAVIPRALTILASDYPEVRVEIVEREPEAGLYAVWARDFDLVIAEQYPGHAAAHLPDLDRVDLCTDELRLAVPPTRTDWNAITDARDMPWVLEPRGTASRHWAEQNCRQAGFEPDVRFETADLVAHIRLIESGNAVGMLPELVWAGEPAPVHLVTLQNDPRRTVFTAARRSSSSRPAVLACRDALARAVEFVGVTRG